MKFLFSFLKNIVQFLKIAILFIFLVSMVYWLEQITKSDWAWLNFFEPVIKNFIAIGSMISSTTWKVFEATIEFKYIATFFVFVGLYYSMNLLNMVVEKVEDLCDDAHRAVKKAEENRFNESLEKKHTSEQTKIQTYQIYVSASIKKKFSHKELKVNLEEQLNIMNKFLMDKTSVIPEKFENGFLYTFNRFDEIDSTLETFFKLLKAQTPLDYIICVQIVKEDFAESKTKLKTLIDLNFENKISMFAETSFRYKFNKSHRYGTTQLGLFGNGNNTFETHEFIEI